MVKELQSLALDIRVLDENGEEIELSQLVDEDDGPVLPTIEEAENAIENSEYADESDEASDDEDIDGDEEIDDFDEDIDFPEEFDGEFDAELEESDLD